MLYNLEVYQNTNFIFCNYLKLYIKIFEKLNIYKNKNYFFVNFSFVRINGHLKIIQQIIFKILSIY